MKNKNKLLKFLGEKSVKMVIIILFACIISFTLVENSPIDPVRAYIGEMSLTPEKQAELEEYWGVNKNPVEKFFHGVQIF